MSIPIDDLPDIPADLIDEIKAFLRLDHDEDDPAIAEMAGSASLLCESFTRQLLVARMAQDMLPVKNVWQKLSRLPVQAIDLVESVAADGLTQELSSDDYIVDIDSDGQGWIRLQTAVSVSRVRVSYAAGLVADWEEVPTMLRQGIVRMTGYFYANRDSNDVHQLPHAVSALWRPYRRMRMG
ncbi:hypothetical protein [Parasphingorhabdus sp.]|uniref:head-tail connector protein n=1 Tax=Parasphingorhabdus sp. TaxID=2709688 RepID=UPI003267150A